MTGNDYYAIACNDLLFLQATLHLPLYNQITVQTQQVVEKMLKSVAERTCAGIERLMNSHNLRAIYDAIHQNVPEIHLNRGDLSMLKDFYFDAKYPGDNFVVVDRDTCIDCLQVMYEVIKEVNRIRQNILHLPIQEYKEIYLQGDEFCQNLTNETELER